MTTRPPRAARHHRTESGDGRLPPPVERGAGGSREAEGTSARSQRPLTILDDVPPAVLDEERGVEAVAIEVERAHVLPAGVGIVVVTEGEVDGAEQPFLRRRACGSRLARPEGELADH